MKAYILKLGGQVMQRVESVAGKLMGMVKDLVLGSGEIASTKRLIFQALSKGGQNRRWLKRLA